MQYKTSMLNIYSDNDIPLRVIHLKPITLVTRVDSVFKIGFIKLVFLNGFFYRFFQVVKTMVFTVFNKLI